MGRKLKEINKKGAICMSGNEAAEKFCPLLDIKRSQFLSWVAEGKFVACKIGGRILVYIPSIIQYLDKTPEERKVHPQQIGFKELWRKDWHKYLPEKATAIEIGRVLGISSRTVSEFIKKNLRSVEKFFRNNGRGNSINPVVVTNIMRDMDE